MIDLYINRTPRSGAWGGGNLAVKALYEAHSSDVSISNVTRIEPNVVLLIGLDSEDGHLSLEDAVRLREASKGRTKVILRLNDNDARKGTCGLDDRVIAASTKLDGTIFVSHWMHDTFLAKGWKCPKNVVIINGCEAYSTLQPNDVRISGQISIVSHHWSDNPLKGSDVTEFLDDFVGQQHAHPKFSFTFVGRTKVKLKNSVHVAPLYGQALWNELAQHDVYISASRSDPGPNHVSEAITCGLPTYVHKDGGGCVEFAGLDHVYNDVDDLRRLLLSRSFQPNTTTFYDWNEFSNRVFSFIKEVCL